MSRDVSHAIAPPSHLISKASVFVIRKQKILDIISPLAHARWSIAAKQECMTGNHRRLSYSNGSRIAGAANFSGVSHGAQSIDSIICQHMRRS